MKNQVKTVVLLGALSALLVGIGAALGPGYVTMFGALAVLMNIGAYFFSDKLVLAMYRAKEVSAAQAPRLHAMVDELAAAAAIPKPRVYLIDEQQPNAFATGRNPAHGAVAVTQGLLDRLDARELRGVLAHEIAHIKNRDILVASIAATVASAVTYIAHLAGMLSMFGGRDEGEEGPSALQSLALALVAPIAATLIQLGISRSREYLADETGAELSGDPEALARALEKLESAARHIPAEAQPATASLFIVSPFAGVEGILSLFSTHPRTAERTRRLRALAQTLPLRAAYRSPRLG